MMRAQRGVAVITAILIVALVTSVIVAMLWQNAVRLRQMENLKEMAQAEAVGLAAVDWARAILAEDARKNQVDDLGEPWAMPVPPIAAEGGEISGKITDQQGLFNLNNLAPGGVANEPEVLAFQRLLGSLGLPPELANALVDWIDTDSTVRYPGGAEDADYLSLDPPYRTANQPLTEVSGLYRVKGYSAAVVEALRPYVTALPTATRINLNTALPEVLPLALESGTREDAAAIIAARAEHPFNDLADFDKRMPLLAPRLREAAAGVNSNYFLVETRVRFGKVKLERQALLERDGQAWPVILWKKGR
ncbi:MAG: type II secretion system minor pseudopilin GspK [Sulfuricella sp.]